MPARTHRSTVIATEWLSPDVVQLTLSPPGEAYDFQPGQWAPFHLPIGPRPPLIRPYSFAEPPRDDGALVFALDRVEGGAGSDYLCERAPEDPLTLADPLGNFTLPEPLPAELLLVARFTGIVPIRCMLRALAKLPERPRTRLVYGMPNARELVYHAEMLALAAIADWFEYHPTLLAPDASWDGPVGDELAIVAGLPATPGETHPMICGRRAFTHELRAHFMDRGFERRAVKLENYD